MGLALSYRSRLHVQTISQRIVVSGRSPHVYLFSPILSFLAGSPSKLRLPTLDRFVNMNYLASSVIIYSIELLLILVFDFYVLNQVLLSFGVAKLC